MMKINDIWNQLEEDKFDRSRILMRRYAVDILPDIFVVIRQPENLRGLAVRLTNQHQINVSQFGNLQDIRIEIMPDEYDSNKYYLLIQLTSPEHSNVFATLCEDLITGVTTITDQQLLVNELLSRFEKWKSLFEKASSSGLSPEQQRGLFGELYFLRKWITDNRNLQKCIHAWLGPEKERRDFQVGAYGLEVKTTFGNNHQKLHISSERQLDSSSMTSLMLFHVSLDVQRENGETLNELVHSIFDIIDIDPVVSVFKMKLLAAGYFEQHKTLYDYTGYQIRQETYYQVKDSFPRIEEKDIRPGVGDVKYSIILSSFSECIIQESFVFQTLN